MYLFHNTRVTVNFLLIATPKFVLRNTTTLYVKVFSSESLLHLCVFQVVRGLLVEKSEALTSCSVGYAAQHAIQRK